MTAFPGRLAALACGLVMMGLAAMPAFAQEAAAAAKPATEDARLAAFFEEVFQRNLKDSPIFQAQLGMKGPDYGKWGDFSDKEANRQNELNKNDLVRLRSEFKYDALSSGMKVSYRIFELQQESAVAIFPWRFHNYAFATTSNPATQFATFMQNIHAVDDVSDAEAYVSRLNLLEPAARQGIETMNMAAERGIVPTSFSFDPVLSDGRAVLTGAPFDASDKDSALLADFRGKVNKLEIADAEKKRLLDEGIAAMKGPVKTGIEAMLATIESLRAKSPGPNGVWKLPDGDGFYKSQIAFWTTEPDLTASQIHDIGLAEVARIRGENGSDHEEGRLPGRPAGLLQAPAHAIRRTSSRTPTRASRPISTSRRHTSTRSTPTSASTSTCCRRRRSRCAASRNGAKKPRRSRSTTSRRRTAAARASTTST